MQRVKVAVLDTGIDSDHPFIIENWHRPPDNDKRYHDFTSEMSSEQPLKPVDNDGHGTHVAGIILQFAPDVELYVARIGTTRKAMKKDDRVESRIKDVGVPSIRNALLN
jgi:subtilisin family serine protease